jgi:hypothetical protein
LHFSYSCILDILLTRHNFQWTSIHIWVFV